MATVRVALEVDPSTGKAKLLEFARGLDKVDDSAKRVSKAAKDLAKDAGDDLAAKLGPGGRVLAAMGPGGLAAAAGLGATAAAMGVLVRAAVLAVQHLVSTGSNLRDLADRSKIGVEALQEFGFAAQMTGASTEDFVAALKFMQVNLVENEDKFRRLGIQVSDLRGMKPEDQFMRVAEAIHGMTNAEEQAAAAQAVFGRGAAAILPAIREGMEGLRDKARELGVVLSEDVVNASDALGDEATKLKLAWEAVQNQLAAVIVQNPELLGALTDTANAIGTIAKVISDNKASLEFFFNVFGGTQLKGARAQAKVFEDMASHVSFALGGSPGAPKPKTPTGFGANAPSMNFEGALAAGLREASRGAAQVDKDLAALKRQAEEAERILNQKARAMADVMKASAKDMDAYWDSQEKKASDLAKKLLDTMLDNLKAMSEVVRASTADTEQFWADQEELASRKGAKVLEDLLDRQREAEENFQRMVGSIHDVAGGFESLGDVIGGVLGDVLKFAGSTIGSLGSIAEQIHKLNTDVDQGGLKGAGGIGGFLGKFGAGLGIAGAALGIGKSIFGAIFGSKEEERKREQERAAAQQKAITDLQSLQERMERFRMDKVRGEVTGVTAMFKNLATSADVSQERIDRLGRLGAAALAQLKAEGLSSAEAMEVFGPALDAAIEAADKAGLELPPALAQLAAFRQKLVDNADLVAANEGWAAFVEGVLATGGATKEVMADLMAEQSALFDQLLAKGFTVPEALAEQARGLYALQQAAAAGRISVDEETQALIDQAEALGLFDNLKDPMAEMVEIQKLMLETTAALAKVFGAILPAEVQKYIDKLHQIPQVPGAPGGGGASIPAPDASKFPEDIPGFASGGMVSHTPPYGALIRVAEREDELVVPKSRMSSTANVAGGGGMNFTYAPQLSITGAGGDPRAIAREVAEALRQEDAKLKAQVRRVVLEVQRERRR